MASYLSLKPFTIFFFIFITITTFFLSSHCDDAENFNKCSIPYDCGDIKNVTFPFWGGRRDQVCGLQGFHLECKEDHSFIHINELEFRILKPDQFNEGNKMTIAMSNSCSPPVSPESTLGFHLFKSDPKEFTNLTLIYNCSEQLKFSPKNFSCDYQGVVYYADDDQMKKLGPHLNQTCRTVKIPVPWATIGKIMSGKRFEVEEALREGFEVEYHAPAMEHCGACLGAGGICGSNNQTNSFVCYCRDHLGDQYTCNPHRTPSIIILLHGLAAGCVPRLGAAVFGMLLTCLMICCFRYNVSAVSSKNLFIKVTKSDRDLEAFIRDYGHINAKRYRFSHVKKMTRSFKDKLGQGGYGEVYRGKLLDGRLVAVKLLNSSKGNGEDFINEVASISRTSHVNVVTLLGFCLEGNKRALIYEFMPNGSLEKFIYKDNQQLEREKLLQIATGIARGLEYLHRGCNTRILHFDIKPHNILLDEDLCPKISDFGLAKVCPKKESIISMLDARGTIGYIAPEVWSRNFGGVSSKSDVYSYGMMILEMAGGRENVKVGVSHTSEIYFPDYIYKQLELNGSNLQLQGTMTIEENEIARKMLLVGLWCIQTKPSDRPSMSKVIEMLEGNLEALQIPPKPYLFSPKSPEVFLAESQVEFSTTSVS
ncbi:hypothetical protein UlMin_008602 [Ulmus minor]